MFSFLFIVLLLIFLLMILSSCIRVVPQARTLVVERMGAYVNYSVIELPSMETCGVI